MNLLQETWRALLRLIFSLSLVSQGQDLFANALCERLELLHRVANARARGLVAVPVELLEIGLHRGDELLELCETARRGRCLGLGGLGVAVGLHEGCYLASRL